MENDGPTAEQPGAPTGGAKGAEQALFEAPNLLILVLLIVLYWRAGTEMVKVWRLVDSYYSHGFLVPLVSLFLVWTKRGELARAPRRTSLQGYVWIVGAGLMLLLGDFLGFRVVMQISMLPMIVGVCLLFQGAERTKLLWFPIVYLIFMIPIPPSITQSFALRLKLFATECAVAIANWCTLPIVRDGSSVHWITANGSDHLMIGEVCGGLRSLIALLAFGALMAYLSKTRPWARLVVLLMAGPFAVIANVFRIFLLCAIGYNFGSGVAAGSLHDVSGYLIFVIAFLLFFTLETQLRRWAPRSQRLEEAP